MLVLEALAGLLGLSGAQGERSLLVFACDTSKQLLALLALSAFAAAAPAAAALAQATLGVALNYAGLAFLANFHEQILEGLRTGEYHDETGEFDPIRYFHQLWLWMLCVFFSEFVIASLELQAACLHLLQMLLTPFNWIDLEGPSMLIICCLCRALQFRATDVALLRRGGLAAPKALALLGWAVLSAAATTLRSLAEHLGEEVRSSQEPLLNVEAKRTRRGAAAARAEAQVPQVPQVPQVQAQASAPTLPAPERLMPRDQSPSPKKPKSGGTWMRTGRDPTIASTAVDADVRSLKGMFAERDSDLRELRENLDELLKDFTGLGLEQSPLPAFSPASPAFSPTSVRSSPSFRDEIQGDHHIAPPHFGRRPPTREQTIQTQATPEGERRSRRYEVLDKKIDSLLNALGAQRAPPTLPPARGEGETIDERLEVLQQKMDHLFQLRDAHARK